MAEIVGLNTTFTSPNYYGDLFLRSPADTPFLSAIGGLAGLRVTVGGGSSGTSRAGVKVIDSPKWSWQMTDLRNPSIRARLEGADAPQATARAKTKEQNVLQVVQESIATSYTRASSSGNLQGIVPAGAPAGQNEHATQVGIAVLQAKRDLEYAFINSVYQDPDTNTDVRRTRGILDAIKTNVIPLSGPLTTDAVGNILQAAWQSGGLVQDDTRTLLVGAKAKRALTKLYVTDKGYQEQTRNVGGVALDYIRTDFGNLNLMLLRNIPDDTIAAVSLEECLPVALNIVTEDGPQGLLFVEALAKTGAQLKHQLYGEWGLESGNELMHAKLTGITYP